MGDLADLRRTFQLPRCALKNLKQVKIRSDSISLHVLYEKYPYLLGKSYNEYLHIKAIKKPGNMEKQT